MQAHPGRLRELLAEEDALDSDTQAAADSAVRAHLRFAAEALPVGLRPDLAARVEGMADDLDAWFEADVSAGTAVLCQIDIQKVKRIAGCVSGAVTGQPAVAHFGDAPQDGVGTAAEPDGNRLLPR